MDIIKFLIRDHIRLRDDLVQIKKNLNRVELPEKINELISHMEIHESVEEKILFPGLSSNVRTQLHPARVSHTQIWAMLDQFREVTRLHQTESVQQSFFNFDFSVEAHFNEEEQVLFPIIEKLVDIETLEELGKKAEKFYEKFFVALA